MTTSPEQTPTTGQELLLERNTFLTRFGFDDPTNRTLRRLYDLVAACREPVRAKDAAVEWIEALGAWLFGDGALPGQHEDETDSQAHLRLLLLVADELPQFAAYVRASVIRVLAGTSSTLLFADTGISSRVGFWSELVDRFTRNVLPQPPVGREMSRLLSRLLHREEHALLMTMLSDDDRARVVRLLGLDGDDARRVLEPGQREAMLLLAARISMQGVSDDIRRRITSSTIDSSPFLALPIQVRALLEGQQTPTRVLQIVTACQGCLREVSQSLDATGISVDLVFRLELVRDYLSRLNLLVLMRAGTDQQRDQATVTLAHALLQGTVADRSLGALWRSSTGLLARRVVERAGTSGQDYLTRTRREQQAMLDAAAGGGAIIAVAALIKFLIHDAHPPPLIEAMLFSLNYIGAFVLMQLTHFALATKQPSMTAAALAGAIEAHHEGDGDGLGQLVDLVARASRTQFAALLGNVFVVVPFSIAIALTWPYLFGHDVLSADGAEALIRQHHPLGKSTMFSAAMTGVWLWAASLIAGAAENYFVLRELPGAIATNHALRAMLGVPRAARLSRFLSEEGGALGGNVGFGMLLGFMPLLFVLVGLPLDGGHVTFISSQLAYAAIKLGPTALMRADFLVALLSVPLVGLLNFGVSFAFAIVVALRARDLGVKGQLALFRAVARHFLRSPRDFFLAPKDPEPTAVEASPAVTPSPG